VGFFVPKTDWANRPGGTTLPQFAFITEPIDDDEQVLGFFYGGRGQVGQKLVVTNRRLMMGPLDTKIALEIDTYLLGKAGLGGMDLLKNVLTGYAPMNAKSVALTHVTGVEATNKGSLSKAPGLRVTTDSGDVFDLGVVATPTTWNPSPRNPVARDKAVALIKEAVANLGPKP
jgi:hypothetical protein